MKFYSLASRNFKEIYRDPVSIVLGLLLPVVLLILFASLEKNIGFKLFSPSILTPGIIVFCFAFLIMFSSVLLAKDKQSAFLTRLFTTPLTPTHYIISYLLPFIPIAFIQTLICVIVGVVMGATFSNVALAILFFMLFAMACISLGVIMGSLFNVSQVSAIGSVLITAIGLFSGVWIDLKLVGGIFELIGYALPFAHVVDVAKSLMAEVTIESFYQSLLVVLLYTMVFFVLAIISFKRCMKRI